MYPIPFNKHALSLKPYVYFANSPYNKIDLYSTCPISKINNYEYLSESFKNNNSKNLKNEINKNGYRCDSFTDKHEGTHVLFSGCSVTFGSGLELNDTWAKKVYDKISKIEKTSGYFNIGVWGNSILNQISDLFKYFYTYGNPNTIFICIPDLSRFYVYDLDNKNIVDGLYNKQSQNIINLLSYQYYLMLYQYCNVNNIRLITFSWFTVEDKTTNDFEESKIKYFNTFYDFNLEDLAEFVKNFSEKNPNMLNVLDAMDGEHMGIAYHEFWADFIYEKYLNQL